MTTRPGKSANKILRAPQRMLPSDRIAYSAITERPQLLLPDGARMALWVIVNVEEWDPREAMPRTPGCPATTRTRLSASAALTPSFSYHPVCARAIGSDGLQYGAGLFGHGVDCVSCLGEAQVEAWR